MASTPMADMTFVLIHGAYHTARCWDRLTPHLAGESLPIDLPGRGSSPADLRHATLASWRDAITDSVDRTPTRHVALIGHSLGGLLLSSVAGSRQRKVSHLIYLSAVIPADGGTQRANLPVSGRLGARLTARGGVLQPPPRWLARTVFCNGMGRPLTKRALSTLVPEAAGVFDEPVHQDPTVESPALYVCLAKDRAVTPKMAEGQIANLGRPAEVAHLNAGHEVMISQPQRLARIINAFALNGRSHPRPDT